MARLRFGKIENENLPKDFLKRLAKNVKRYGVRVRDTLGRKRGFRFAKDEGEFIFIRVVKDIKEKKPFYDEKKDKEIDTYSEYDDFINLGIFKKTLEIICETTAKTSFEDISNMLKEAWELIKNPDENSLRIKSIDKFSHKLLKEFYKDSKEVTGVKLTDIGQMPPNPTPTPEDLKKTLDDFKENVDSADFKSGGRKRSKKNIKKSKVIGKVLVPVSKISWIRGQDIENYYFNITTGGTLVINLPSKEDKAKEKMKKIFKRFSKFIFE